MEYTSLQALKNFGGFEGEEEDDLLLALIQSATGIIETRTGRIFKVEAEADQIFSRYAGVSNRFDGNMLYFYKELADEASAITDSPTVVHLPENGPPYYGIRKVEGSWAYPAVTVTGYWGYSKTPPPDIEMACLRLAKWLYDMKDTHAGNSAIITPEGKVLLPQGLPSDVMALLKPYVKVVVV
jgi:hypothetical protein